MKNIKVSVLTIAMLTAVGALADGNTQSTGTLVDTAQPAPAAVVQPAPAPAPAAPAPVKPADATAPTGTANTPAPDASKPATAGFFAKLGNNVSQAWAAVKAAPGATWDLAKAHPYWAAAAVVTVPVAVYAIATNWKQIKKAIVNNPGKTAAVLGVAAVVACAYKYDYLPSFGSKAADVNAPVAAPTTTQAPATSTTTTTATPAAPVK